MKPLFFCNTPYQVIVSIQIAQTKFKEIKADIIVTDRTSNAERLYKNIVNSGFFSNVYLIYPKKKFDGKKRSELYIESIKQKILHRFYWNNDMQLKNDYDELYFANPTFEVSMVANAIKNPKLKLYMFEDAFASYTNYYGDMIERLYDKTIHGFIKRIFFPRFYNIRGIYVFSPEYVMWHHHFPVYKIDKIKKEHLSNLNRVFGYQNIMDKYDSKVIFFEESYYADGVDVHDEEFVKKIAQIIGVKNVFVKLHPRSSNNRFESCGIRTNTDTFVPWEIIAINIDIEDKVLVSIASCSAASSMINTGKVPKKIIMLMKCQDVKQMNLTPATKALEIIADDNKDVISLPATYEQAMDEIKKILKSEVDICE